MLICQTPYGDLHIIPLQVIPYPYPLSTVFPQAVTVPPSRAASVRGIQPPTHAIDGEAGGVGAAKDLTQDVEQGKLTWEETMGFLKIMEYRYTKFALQPGTNRWAMIRDWRDPRWTSARAVAGGLDAATRQQRRTLMGDNMIDIASKSLFGLLIDEVGAYSLSS
jgi:cation-transporting ATPase 13A2